MAWVGAMAALLSTTRAVGGLLQGGRKRRGGLSQPSAARQAEAGSFRGTYLLLHEVRLLDARVRLGHCEEEGGVNLALRRHRVNLLVRLLQRLYLHLSQADEHAAT